MHKRRGQRNMLSAVRSCGRSPCKSWPRPMGWRRISYGGAPMRVAIFSAKSYERKLLDELTADHRHELVYFDTLLEPSTTALAAEFTAVSVFVNDVIDAHVLKDLAAGGTKLVATRSTGFPDRRGGGKDAWRQGRAGHRLFAKLRGRVCRWLAPRARSQDSAGLQPHARGQFRA